MNGTPDALIHHSVDAGNAAELRAELAERLPDLTVRTAAAPPETAELIRSAEIVLTWELPADLLAEAAALRWVQALSAGVDHYDRDRLREEGIVLTNASGVHAEPIAEQVLGYLLLFERGIHRGIRQQHRGVWEHYTGGELRGKTLGIVGVGAIGGRVAELGAALGMTVVGTKRDPDDVVDAVDEAFAPGALYEVLGRADYLVVACPLTDETRGLIGADQLGAMKTDAVLVNVARGEIVDEAALVRALQQRDVRGAALDVFETEPLPATSPLWDLSNAVVTPHMAGWTPRLWERIADIFAPNYRAYVEGDPDAMDNRIC